MIQPALEGRTASFHISTAIIELLNRYEPSTRLTGNSEFSSCDGVRRNSPPSTQPTTMQSYSIGSQRIDDTLNSGTDSLAIIRPFAVSMRRMMPFRNPATSDCPSPEKERQLILCSRPDTVYWQA